MRVQEEEPVPATVGNKRDTPPQDPPTAKRLKQRAPAISFLLRQRQAPLDGLRDILDVGDVAHITFNGGTCEYLYYITSLVLETAQDKLSIYRCNDGRLAHDDSDEWKKLDPHDSLQGGIHLVQCSDGSPEFSLSD